MVFDPFRGQKNTLGMIIFDYLDFLTLIFRFLPKMTFLSILAKTDLVPKNSRPGSSPTFGGMILVDYFIWALGGPETPLQKPKSPQII